MADDESSVHRILLVLNSATGGATLSALDLARGMRARGSAVFIVVPPGFGAAELASLRVASDGLVEIALPWWNRNYRALPYKRPLVWARELVRSGASMGTLRSLVGAIRRWKIDIVHTNTSLTIEPALAARLTGRPHVWHIREQIGAQGLFRFWLPEPMLARVFASLSTQMVANSEETRRFFVRHGLGDGVRVVYNGIDVERFAQGRERRTATRRRWGIGDETPLVGMVAALTSRMKRHEDFVRAAAVVAHEVPEARFVVVGRDPEQVGGYRSELAYTRAVKAQAAHAGLDGRIQWLGHDDDVPAVMSALDVLVHPSDRESFGRVALEAMAAGTPVVGARGGGLPEIIDEEETGLLVEPRDVAGFATAITRLLRAPELRGQMAAAGPTHAARRFSVASTVDAMAEIYTQLATEQETA